MPVSTRGPNVRARPGGTEPSVHLAPRDGEGLLAAWETYHPHVSPLVYRTEPRDWATPYLRGQLVDIPRTSIEPMVVALAGPTAAAVRAMPPFLRAGAGDDAALLTQPQRLVDETLGAEDGVVLVDGRGLPTQGQHSVGVARQ